MDTENKELLPIGSVVILKGAIKRLMINGYYSASLEKPNKIYDYSGCLFPEGVISSKVTALFNHNQIEKVYFKGLLYA